MNPLDYRWGHAINSRALLRRVHQEVQRATTQPIALHDFVNAIEADIIWSEAEQRPVMGHPPATTGDLTLAAFLQTMLDVANMLQHVPVSSDPPLIVKCDFKSPQAFEASLDLLAAFLAAYPFTRSVFLNADIVPGPETPLVDGAAFDGAVFLQQVDGLGARDGGQHRHKLVLSVGWTTVHSQDLDVDRGYSIDMVDAMLQLLQPYRDTTNKCGVTFPLRATSVRRSWPAVRQLLEHPRYGLTLWWAPTQLPDEELEWLYTTLERERHVEGPPADGKSYAGRTFYDIKGFRSFLARQKGRFAASIAPHCTSTTLQ
ncbi:unnamed protein product [Hyaloperonospora brassicae]|uniref:Menorin-like domain-containing protein n=1 Tax=Hyaloperonospora brassicae TaxID=162125 RepID=A0AAV0UFB2_HYABA|nr:unnamed protein product [Hyaloperonospora brassicae]